MSDEPTPPRQSLATTTLFSPLTPRTPDSARRDTSQKSSPLGRSSSNGDPREDDNGPNLNHPPRRRKSRRHGDESGSHEDESKRKTSGGFLLRSTFGHISKKRPQIDEHQELHHGQSSKSSKVKGRATLSETLDGQNNIQSLDSAPAGQGAMDDTSSNVNVANVDFRSVNTKMVGTTTQERASSSHSHTDSSMGSSPSQFKQPSQATGADQLRSDRQSLDTPVIDPSQIVRMALTLKDARRMHLAPGNLGPPTSADERRATSVGLPPLGKTLTGSYHEAGSSLRQALQGPSNTSRNTSPNARISSNPQQRRTSTAVASPRPGETFPSLYLDEEELKFSAATLARAERARIFIELSHEYRRLLHSLPPLVPYDARSEGRQHSSSVASNGRTSRPGTSADTIQSSAALGRPYNPLQYIRNRRIRARERAPLDAEATGWNDIHRVQTWIGSVENASKNPDFWSDDTAFLPDWGQPPAWMVERHPTVQPPADKDEHGNKTKRQKLDWSVNPADLLADAYWLEQDSHKSLIESKNGNKIFPHANQKRRRLTAGTENSADPRDFHGVQVEDFGSPESALSKSPESISYANKIEDAADAVSPSRHAQGLSKAARVKRRLLRRPRVMSVSSAEFSASEDEARDMIAPTGKDPHSENTGPLERYMKKLETELRKNHKPEAQSPIEEPDAHGRRMGVSEATGRDSEQIDRVTASRDTESPEVTPKSSFSIERRRTPRISIENADRDKEGDINGAPAEMRQEDVSKSKQYSLKLLRRGKGKSAQNQALESKTPQNGSGRSSFESLTGNRSFTSPSDLRPSRSRSYDELVPAASTKQTTASNAKRLFKGGRIGELVRSEKPGADDIVWKRDPPKKGSVSSFNAGATGNSSDDGTLDRELAPKNQPTTNRSSRPPMSRVRSHTSADSRTHQYRTENLPAFTSLKVPDGKGIDRPSTAPDGDHIARQQQARDIQKQASRLKNLAPPGLNTGEISPGSSSLDLSRYNSANLEREQTKATTQTSESERPARAGTLSSKAADRRLKTILGAPGGVGKGGLPITGLSAIEATQRRRNRSSDHRTWSVANSTITLEKETEAIVNAKEIAYVRTLLLASGVKAKGIERHASEPRNKAPDFLVHASKLAETPLKSVPRRQEHILAAQLLSSSLGKSSNRFLEDTQQFRDETCSRLQATIDDLRDKVGSKLIPYVRGCADEADGFMARLMTTHTLAVKQVNDSVDLMIRSRRARLRWLRRAGFVLLEWTLVGLMWWIWLFVLILRVTRNTVVGVYKSVRWLFWF